MGQLHFLVPQPERLSPESIASAHFTGRDRLPLITSAELETPGELLVDREDGESGSFNILWPVEGRGRILLTTSTLIERQQPYLLPLELARGTLNRLRNLLAEWEASGLATPEPVRKLLAEALESFVVAVANQTQTVESSVAAEKSIAVCLTAIDEMAAAIVDQVSLARQRQSQRVVPLFAGRLGKRIPDAAITAAFSAAFNAAAVPFSWSHVEADEGRQDWRICDAQLEWCQTRGLRIGGGPLIELQRHSLPDWIYLWEGDFDNLLMVASDYVRAVVTRYRGKLHFWNAGGRLVTGDALGLDEEQKLRLVLRSVEVIRMIDPSTPVIVSFDQPWAEYMARRETDLHPLQFADALVRADLGVSGVGLEINVGTGERATLPRDPLEFNALLDRWSMLGLPLLMSLTFPSDGADFTPQLQQQWLETYVPIILARPTVQALFWNQLRDQDSDDFPNTGLVDSAGSIKPAFGTLANLRKRFSI
jgi:Glycosyl hydrolase family 10